MGNSKMRISFFIFNAFLFFSLIHCTQRISPLYKTLITSNTSATTTSPTFPVIAVNASSATNTETILMYTFPSFSEFSRLSNPLPMPTTIVLQLDYFSAFNFSIKVEMFAFSNWSAGVNAPSYDSFHNNSGAPLASTSFGTVLASGPESNLTISKRMYVSFDAKGVWNIIKNGGNMTLKLSLNDTSKTKRVDFMDNPGLLIGTSGIRIAFDIPVSSIGFVTPEASPSETCAQSMKCFNAIGPLPGSSFQYYVFLPLNFSIPMGLVALASWINIGLGVFENSTLKLSAQEVSRNWDPSTLTYDYMVYNIYPVKPYKDYGPFLSYDGYWQPSYVPIDPYLMFPLQRIGTGRAENISIRLAAEPPLGSKTSYFQTSITHAMVVGPPEFENPMTECLTIETNSATAVCGSLMRTTNYFDSGIMRFALSTPFSGVPFDGVNLTLYVKSAQNSSFNLNAVEGNWTEEYVLSVPDYQMMHYMYFNSWTVYFNATGSEYVAYTFFIPNTHIPLHLGQTEVGFKFRPSTSVVEIASHLTPYRPRLQIVYSPPTPAPTPEPSPTPEPTPTPEPEWTGTPVATTAAIINEGNAIAMGRHQTMFALFCFPFLLRINRFWCFRKAIVFHNIQFLFFIGFMVWPFSSSSSEKETQKEFEQQPSMSNNARSRPQEFGAPGMSIQQQKLEINAMTDLFSRLNDQCFKKCVTNFSENELSKGEATCIERCTYKYHEAGDKIGGRLQQLFMSQQGGQM